MIKSRLPITAIIMIAILLIAAISLWSVKRPAIRGISTGNVFYEKIPGSSFHGPDATWWGYNQSKIVRFNSRVFMYVIDNQDSKNSTLSKLVVYQKEGNGPWQSGISFPTSRPGNILVDSKGVLHAFVFEPTDVKKNDSIGKLVHYWFAQASQGDITSHQKETVVAAKANDETVNIRVGAAIGSDDTLGVAFGLTNNNPAYKGQSEHLYLKKTGQAWQHLIAGQNLNHDFFYPFVVLAKDAYHLLAVQDDYANDGNPATYDNIYQKIMSFSYSGGTWKKDVLGDLTSHPLAKTFPRLTEQNDLFLDSTGRVHASYKELLDGTSQGHVTGFQHFTKTSSSGWNKETIDVSSYGCNWLKHVEVDGALYYLCAAFDKVYLMNEGRTKVEKLAIPPAVTAIYPYLARNSLGSGSPDAIDLLLLSGNANNYSAHTDYYVRIPKNLFRNLK